VQDSQSLRIGCVKYLNARPLIRGWEGPASADPGRAEARPSELVFDHPAALADQLQRAHLEVALVSSFEFLRNPVYRVVNGISISSDGPVYSVVLAYRGEISKIEQIALDPASLTSAALLRCLLAERGLTPRLVKRNGLESGVRQNLLGSAGYQPAVAGSLPATPAADSTSALQKMSRQAAETNRLAACAPQNLSPALGAQLLIGDQAILFRQRHSDFQFWDLGEEWKKLVDLPFVYALWLVRPEVADAKLIAGQLRALRDANLRNLDPLIAEETDFDHAFCRRYFLNHLRFHFGEKEKQGLQTFAALCASHGLIPKRELTLNVV
jgi:predicted solute-binding protein